jgi:hypothetical protein
MPRKKTSERLILFPMPENEVRDFLKKCVFDAMKQVPIEAPDELLPLKEVRTILNCAPSTLWHYRHKGFIQTVTYGKKVFIRRSELLKLKKRFERDG